MTSGLDETGGGTAEAPAASPKPRTRTAPKPALPSAALRGATVSAAIYRELRAEIVSMRRKPGEPIVEKRIAQDHGVSRTPVREALLRLADEGLVDIFPQSGSFVSRIPVAELPEAILIRKALEEAAVRYAAAQATRSQVAKLRANLELQREMSDGADAGGFHEADEAFHALIADAAGCPGFWTLTRQVKVQVDRYRLLTLPVPGRIRSVIIEHTAIVDAIEAHDPARAAEMMAAHLESLRASIGDIRENNPFFFSDRPEGAGG
ncbi:GntR family transcriptional regulator [Skermanella rosea]|uniref:GntR family transcriptional regulator n=1 Tax=Skermanella rosea TaxID=1817965 RepID=UPI0019316AF6|nr:GntR family transcriptional regulator [Skermanella rosea]UEM02800.1 GntR family transcriptional regulator [Skermanella rosea]